MFSIVLLKYFALHSIISFELIFSFIQLTIGLNLKTYPIKTLLTLLLKLILVWPPKGFSTKINLSPLFKQLSVSSLCIKGGVVIRVKSNGSFKLLSFAINLPFIFFYLKKLAFYLAQQK